MFRLTADPPIYEIRDAAGKSVLASLRDGPIVIGSAADADIRVDHPSVDPHHARVEPTPSGARIIDLGSRTGTSVNGKPISGAELPDGAELKVGDFTCKAKDASPVKDKLARWMQDMPRVQFWAISIGAHLLLILALAQVVMFAPKLMEEDFTSTEESFLTSSQDKGREGRSGESAPKADQIQFSPNTMAQPTAAVQANSMISAITTTANTAQFNVQSGFSTIQNMAKTAMAGKTAGWGGRGRSIGKGFGPGSGLGKAVGEWIGSGEGGLGISGRGKTLKTINEFWCYFVIHSGDWYAALDWEGAPGDRQREVNYIGLPDIENMEWYETDPEDYKDVGPFIAYWYGFMLHQGQKVDARGGCVQFTPGAMSNLLRFIRMASNNNIKGGAKPKGVVLDKSLLPYTFDKNSQKVTWLPEGREKLRENLRENLPGGGKYGVKGYLWNPQPADPAHMDFHVEFLLDIKPMPPFIYFTGNDDFRLSDTEVETLNEYVRRGGAIWGDSGFAGHRSKFDTAFRREMKRVVPDIDKPFKALPMDPKKNMFLTGLDAYFDLDHLPYGMQYYQSPVEVIEIMPGIVSIVLTKNAYGNFLRYQMTRVNNQFQIGGERDMNVWTRSMWRNRHEFFRGLGDQNIRQAYALGSNILVYMLGRWPQALKMGKLNP